MLSKGGTPSTAIGVAVRNIHSTIGISDMRDIEGVIRILQEFLTFIFSPEKECLVNS